MSSVAINSSSKALVNRSSAHACALTWCRRYNIRAPTLQLGGQQGECRTSVTYVAKDILPSLIISNLHLILTYRHSSYKGSLVIPTTFSQYGPPSIDIPQRPQWQWEKDTENAGKSPRLPRHHGQTKQISTTTSRRKRVPSSINKQ